VRGLPSGPRARGDRLLTIRRSLTPCVLVSVSPLTRPLAWCQLAIFTCSQQVAAPNCHVWTLIEHVHTHARNAIEAPAHPWAGLSTMSITAPRGHVIRSAMTPLNRPSFRLQSTPHRPLWTRCRTSSFRTSFFLQTHPCHHCPASAHAAANYLCDESLGTMACVLRSRARERKRCRELPLVQQSPTIPQ
jgi:hypothetical protein